MHRTGEKIKAKDKQAESEEYDSNAYNSEDSFIADDDSESEESEEFQPEAKAKKPKKKWAISKQEVQTAKSNLKGKNRNRRLKKMKEVSQKKIVDDFVDYDDDMEGGRGGKSGPGNNDFDQPCLLYTSPSPRDLSTSRMPSSA